MKKPKPTRKAHPIPAASPSNWKTRWDCADPGFCELVIRLPLKQGRKFFANNKFPVVIADVGDLRAINKAMVTQAAEALATLLLAANRENSKKGTAALNLKKALKKEKAEQLNSELLKTVKKKDRRVKKIAKEMKESERNVWNLLSLKKKPID